MKIVVFTKNWIGDVIFETPAIRMIKSNYPNSHLIVVTPRQCVEVLQTNPYVDEIISFENRNGWKGIWGKLKLIVQLRSIKVDQIFLFHGSKTRARIACWVGAKERIGYDTKHRGRFLTNAIPEPKTVMHDVHYFVGLLREAGFKTDEDYCYDFFFNEEDIQKADQLLAKYRLDPNRLIAINPGANWLPKRWPPDYFKQLAKALMDRFGVQIVITGSAEDQAVADLILNGTTSMVSVCGKTSLRVLGALFSKCQLVISNDSGPMHVASAVGSTVLGLFGPTASQETAPLGRGRNIIIHHAHEGVKLPWIGKPEDFPAPWMELISVDYVLSVIEKENLIPASIS